MRTKPAQEFTVLLRSKLFSQQLLCLFLLL
jgi:hypothetical protein